MNPTQSTLLLARGPALVMAMQGAAVAAGITVAELIEAGIGRGGSSGAPVQAASAFDRAHPGVLAGFRETWPFACAFCGRDVDPSEGLERCAICGTTRGCSGCVTGAGCPTCRALSDEQRAAARATNLERLREVAELGRFVEEVEPTHDYGETHAGQNAVEPITFPSVSYPEDVETVPSVDVIPDEDAPATPRPEES